MDAEIRRWWGKERCSPAQRLWECAVEVFWRAPKGNAGWCNAWHDLNLANHRNRSIGHAELRWVVVIACMFTVFSSAQFIGWPMNFEMWTLLVSSLIERLLRKRSECWNWLKFFPFNKQCLTFEHFKLSIFILDWILLSPLEKFWYGRVRLSSLVGGAHWRSPKDFGLKLFKV